MNPYAWCKPGKRVVHWADPTTVFVVTKVGTFGARCAIVRCGEFYFRNTNGNNRQWISLGLLIDVSGGWYR